jgi:hypothetical protein
MKTHEAILREVCGSDARFRVLRALYEQSGRELHLRRLAATAQVDPGNASKLLARLARAGICERVAGDPYPRYRARRDNPLHEQLSALFAKAGHLSADSEKNPESARRYGDQEQREIDDALALHQLPAALRGRVLAEQFERLQSRANSVMGTEPVEPGIFHFKSHAEKNQRDENVEIARAVRHARATG